jgi:hypothetical protein
MSVIGVIFSGVVYPSYYQLPYQASVCSAGQGLVSSSPSVLGLPGQIGSTYYPMPTAVPVYVPYPVPVPIDQNIQVLHHPVGGSLPRQAGPERLSGRRVSAPSRRNALQREKECLERQVAVLEKEKLGWESFERLCQLGQQQVDSGNNGQLHVAHYAGVKEAEISQHILQDPVAVGMAKAFMVKYLASQALPVVSKALQELSDEGHDDVQILSHTRGTSASSSSSFSSSASAFSAFRQPSIGNKRKRGQR